MEISNTVPGSRFYPIGGTFYRVSVRKRASIRMEVEKEQSKSRIIVHGAVGPARPGQRILVDVLLPDGKTYNSTETKTKATGQFDTALSLLDGDRKLTSGPYKVRLHIPRG